jgi:hypothetical protein
MILSLTVAGVAKAFAAVVELVVIVCGGGGIKALSRVIVIGA